MLSKEDPVQPKIKTEKSKLKREQSRPDQRASCTLKARDGDPSCLFGLFKIMVVITGELVT